MNVRMAPELTLGFEEIDTQHRGIIESMDRAADAARGGDVARTRAEVARLGDQLMSHFTAEEGFMAESLFPDRGRHKAAHDLFMQDFAQLGRALAGEGLSDLVVQWVATRVPEWVKFHIRVNDSALATYLSSKRYRPAARPSRATKPQAS